MNLGEHNERVPLEEISRDWFGEFTVVWKPKTARTRLLSMGMKGDEVRWLRRSLNALQGAASDPEHGDVYDEDLAIAVQNFQREHRLNVDGDCRPANPGRARHGVGRARLAPVAAQPPRGS